MGSGRYISNPLKISNSHIGFRRLGRVERGLLLPFLRTVSGHTRLVVNFSLNSGLYTYLD